MMDNNISLTCHAEQNIVLYYGIYLDYHCNYVIYGYSDKGGPWMMAIHGIYLDNHCNYVYLLL